MNGHNDPRGSHVDLADLERRLRRRPALGEPLAFTPISPEEVRDLLSSEGALAKGMPNFELREEQMAMAGAVADILSSKDESSGVAPLIVEAGTGVGKSIAYLLPAILFAARNNVRVVIATHTIYLQGQLISKDIPNLLTALEGVDGFDGSKFVYGQLKGRGNYLCLNRWQQLLDATSKTLEENTMVPRVRDWLRTTNSGDKSELDISGEELVAWEKVSASNFGACPNASESTCFYRYAREYANSCHLLVVNHALLLSDVLVGGTLIPSYDHLIIDEAHQLEEEATKQFGFRTPSSAVDEFSQAFQASVNELRAQIDLAELIPGHINEFNEKLLHFQSQFPEIQRSWVTLIEELSSFLKRVDPERFTNDDYRVTDSVRYQPEWDNIEISGQAFDGLAVSAEVQITAILTFIDQMSLTRVTSTSEFEKTLQDLLSRIGKLRADVNSFISHPDATTVYWLGQGSDMVSMNGAPLEVGTYLMENLFSMKSSVTLTSATLAVRDGFKHVKQQLGIEDSVDLWLGSPFEYKRSVLLCLPEGIPDPASQQFQNFLNETILELASVIDGRMLVLFTSHRAIRDVARFLRIALSDTPVNILAQGEDGEPYQLVERFQKYPNSVLLGTSSFWEGMDIGADFLKILVVTRMPFSVPTNPVFQARSELFDQPFFQYALPQAILRLRQGFGRLIRKQEDTGAVVILDSRVTSKSYGKWFLDALPDCRIAKGSVTQVIDAMGPWLNAPEAR